MDADCLFTWFGNKRKIRATIWHYLGEVGTLIEPFAGTATITINRPNTCKRVYLNDYDCHIANVLRSVIYKHDEMRQWVYHPRIELDMHMVHDYLITSKPSLRELLMTGLEACDPKMAGWWVWGCNNWLGGGWCSDACLCKTHFTKRMKPIHSDKLTETTRRKLDHHDMLTETWRQKPSKVQSDDIIDSVYQSLRPCRVLYGDFERVLCKPYFDGLTGVVLDPPYQNTEASYSTDCNENETFTRAYNWFMDNRLSDQRIIFCCQKSDLKDRPLPGDIRVHQWSRTSGYAKDKEIRHQELLLLNHACRPAIRQYNVFE